jgi:hypothetical protein
MCDVRQQPVPACALPDGVLQCWSVYVHQSACECGMHDRRRLRWSMSQRRLPGLRGSRHGTGVHDAERALPGVDHRCVHTVVDVDQLVRLPHEHCGHGVHRSDIRLARSLCGACRIYLDSYLRHLRQYSMQCPARVPRDDGLNLCKRYLQLSKPGRSRHDVRVGYLRRRWPLCELRVHLQCPAKVPYCYWSHVHQWCVQLSARTSPQRVYGRH